MEKHLFLEYGQVSSHKRVCQSVCGFVCRNAGIQLCTTRHLQHDFHTTVAQECTKARVLQHMSTSPTRQQKRRVVQAEGNGTPTEKSMPRIYYRTTALDSIRSRAAGSGECRLRRARKHIGQTTDAAYRPSKYSMPPTLRCQRSLCDAKTIKGSWRTKTRRKSPDRRPKPFLTWQIAEQAEPQRLPRALPQLRSSLADKCRY